MLLVVIVDDSLLCTSPIIRTQVGDTQQHPEIIDDLLSVDEYTAVVSVPSGSFVERFVTGVERVDEEGE